MSKSAIETIAKAFSDMAAPYAGIFEEFLRRGYSPVTGKPWEVGVSEYDRLLLETIAQKWLSERYPGVGTPLYSPFDSSVPHFPMLSHTPTWEKALPLHEVAHAATIAPFADDYQGFNISSSQYLLSSHKS